MPRKKLKDLAKPGMTEEEIAAAFRAYGGTPKDLPKKRKPAKYTEDIPDKLVEYFTFPAFREVPETWYHSDGTVKKEGLKLLPNPPRHISLFAWQVLGVSPQLLYDWAQTRPRLASAISHARALRKETVVTNGLLGLYNPLVVKLAAANWFGWHDSLQVKTEVTSVLVKYHMPELEAPLPSAPSLPPPLPALPPPS